MSEEEYKTLVNQVRELSGINWSLERRSNAGGIIEAAYRIGRSVSGAVKPKITEPRPGVYIDFGKPTPIPKDYKYTIEWTIAAALKQLVSGAPVRVTPDPKPQPKPEPEAPRGRFNNLEIDDEKETK